MPDILKIGNLHAVYDGHEYRKLAALPPEPHLLASAPKFSDHYPVTGPSEWEERDYAFYDSPVRNQSRYGSCTGQAGVCALDTVYRMIGVEVPPLSATFPYGLVNGGRDNGASVSSILKVLREVGTCLYSQVPTHIIFKRQFKREAWETAKNYMITEAFLCRSFEELCSAIHQGFPVSLGIMVGDDLGQLDGEGVCPIPRRVVGGHAMCGIGLKKSNLRNEWLIKVQNSWSPKWGMKGFAYLRKAHFGQIYDGYALVYPKEPKERDLPVVPLKKVADLELVKAGEDFALAFVSLPDRERKAELRKLKKENPELHIVVCDKLEDIKNNRKENDRV